MAAKKRKSMKRKTTTRRRKMHGLSASPAEHKRKAVDSAQSAIRQLEFATEHAAKSHCRAALDNLVSGLIQAGEFQAHQQEAKITSSDTMVRVNGAYDAFERAFVRACRITDRRK